MEAGLTEKQGGKWRVAAGLAPVILLGAQCSWAGVLGTAGLWGLLILVSPGDSKPRNGILRALILGLTAAETMHAVRESWPGAGQQWIPVILGILALWAAIRGGEQAAQGSILLLWPAGILLGAVLLSGLGEIQMENLKPVQLELKPVSGLLTVLLIIYIGGNGEKKAKGSLWGKLTAVGLSSALVTQGVLAGRLQMENPNPFYLMGRSVDLLGKMKRMESLILLGMLLGIYLWMTYLMVWIGEGKAKKLITAAGAAALYMSGIRVPMGMIPVLVILTEYLIPAMQAAHEK